MCNVFLKTKIWGKPKLKVDDGRLKKKEDVPKCAHPLFCIS